MVDFFLVKWQSVNRTVYLYIYLLLYRCNSYFSVIMGNHETEITGKKRL